MVSHLRLSSAAGCSTIGTLKSGRETSVSLNLKIRAAVAMAVSALMPATACAQSYPSKQLRIVVAFPAGGPIDIVARMITAKLSEAMGQSVIVDNRGGAGGTIGVDHIAKSAPDGYSMVLSSTALAIYPHVYPKLPFDAFRDLAAVSQVSTTPELLVVHPSLPVKNVKELIALAKARPGQINAASTGNGGLPHLVLELFKSETGTQIMHVPYGGAAPATTNTLGGHTQMMVADVPVLLPHAQSGRLRALAITVANRSVLLPDVPTMVEQGVPRVEASNWYGIFVAGKTPRDVIDRLNAGLNKALADKDLRERLTARGAEPLPGTPEQLGAILKADYNRWGPVVKSSGVKLD
jgi:tripartite-type tricarboxylate transporter receptor subunit TctC